MKLKKTLASILATIVTVSSLSCINVYADSNFDAKLGSIVGKGLDLILNTSYLSIPDDTSHLRLDKGYKAIWSNTRDITADDIKNIVTFYNTDGSVDNNPNFSFAPMGLTGDRDRLDGTGIIKKANETSSVYKTFADFIVVYYGSHLYYIPFVAAPPSEDDAYNIYWCTNPVPQKPKRITLLEKGTPNYYLKNYQNGYKFADTYSNYKFLWDFYDADEIYFLREKEKNYFTAIADKETDGDFYDSKTKTDGDLYWCDNKSGVGNTDLYAKMESGANHIDEGYRYGIHYVPVFASDSSDIANIKIYNPTGIKIAVQPTKTNYVEGQKFDKSGMKVVMNCSDKDNEFEVDYNYDDTTLTTDTTAVKVYATLKNNQKCYTSVPVSVTKKAVGKIEMTKQPNKTNYVEGEALNLDGAVFTVTYNDGTTEEVDNRYLNINYSEGTALTTSDTTVNVSYGDGSVDVPVNVVSKQITALKVVNQPDKLSYVAGQTFDLTGLEVEATYNDGTTAIINDYDSSPDMYVGAYNGNSLIGDVNSDGNIDKVDAALALKIASGMNTGTTEVDLVAADCNLDGNIDAVDAVWILRYKPGMAFINITKDGKADYFYVNVVDKQITALKVVNQPTKTNYVEGQQFDPTGMVIEAVYNDGTTAIINDYVVDSVVTAGQNNVYVTYNGLYTTVPINVIDKVITKLEVTHQPVKTEYVEGQQFDPTGMVIEAVYNDGSTAIIDDYTVNSDKLSLDDTKVTISKDGKETSVPITVIEKTATGIEITKLPDKLSYSEGEVFDPAGMIVTAKYNDGTTAEITDYTYTTKPFEKGDTNATIEYKGYTADVDIILTVDCDELLRLVNEKNGDLNRDGYVTPEDAMILTKVLGSVVDYGYKSTHNGDVDGDEALTNDDVTLIKNYINGNVSLSGDALANADIDGDGEVTAYDAVLVEKAVLNMWSLDTVYAANADANDDGAINMLDVIWILNTHYKHTTIDHITIEKAPDKTNYIEGQTFDRTGMVVQAVYKDGTVEEITDYTYPVRPLITDDTIVVISFDGNEAEQPISVYKKAISGSDDDKLPTTEVTTEVTTENTSEATTSDSEVTTSDTSETTTESTSDDNNGNASGVRIVNLPTKRDYVEGQIFEADGIEIEISYNDGSVEYINASNVTVDETPLKVGDKYGIVFFTYNDLTEKINVPISVTKKEIVSVEVTKQPDKTTYVEGQKFDPTGAEVTITYNDGTKEVVKDTDIDLGNNNPLTTDDTSVTVIVGGVEVEIPVTVIERKPVKTEIVSNPSKTEYTEGEKFDPDGTKIKVTYNDDTEETYDADDITVKEDKTLTTDDKAVTVIVDGTEVEIPVTVNKKTETTTKSHSGGGAGMSNRVTSTTTETTTEKVSEDLTVVEKETEATTKTPFKDVTDHWAEEYIEYLHNKGVLNGVTDELFKPDMSTKRGDFAVVLSKMLNLEKGNVTFTDVPSDSYYAEAISACASADVFVGYGNRTFKPEQTITREEMFVIMAKLFAGTDYNFNSVDTSNLADFADGENTSWWAKPYVAYLISNGIVVGDNGNIKPHKMITRAEMAVVIYNYLNK